MANFLTNNVKYTNENMKKTLDITTFLNNNIIETNNTKYIVNYIYSIAGDSTGTNGEGTAGFNGDNQLATNAQLYYPEKGCVDSGGNVYIADSYNNKIRFIPKVSGTYFNQTMTASYIYSIAGDSTGTNGAGTEGFNGDNKLATTARLYFPNAVCVDSGGNVYIADTLNNKLRFIPKVSGIYFNQTMTANYIYSIAGDSTGTNGAGTYGFNGDNKLATTAQINYPTGVCVDSGGNVYISEVYNNKIRIISNINNSMNYNYFGQPMSNYYR